MQHRRNLSKTGDSSRNGQQPNAPRKTAVGERTGGKSHGCFALNFFDLNGNAYAKGAPLPSNTLAMDFLPEEIILGYTAATSNKTEVIHGYASMRTFLTRGSHQSEIMSKSISLKQLIDTFCFEL